MVGQSALFDDITKVAEDYLGPAASRIMHRLITNHLNKDPNYLEHNDIQELAKWTRLAVSVVTEDQATIDEFIERMRRFSKTR